MVAEMGGGGGWGTAPSGGALGCFGSRAAAVALVRTAPRGEGGEAEPYPPLSSPSVPTLATSYLLLQYPPRSKQYLDDLCPRHPPQLSPYLLPMLLALRRASMTCP